MDGNVIPDTFAERILYYDMGSSQYMMDTETRSHQPISAIWGMKEENFSCKITLLDYPWDMKQPHTGFVISKNGVVLFESDMVDTTQIRPDGVGMWGFESASMEVKLSSDLLRNILKENGLSSDDKFSITCSIQFKIQTEDGTKFTPPLPFVIWQSAYNKLNLFPVTKSGDYPADPDTLLTLYNFKPGEIFMVDSEEEMRIEFYTPTNDPYSIYLRLYLSLNTSDLQKYTAEAKQYAEDAGKSAQEAGESAQDASKSAEEARKTVDEIKENTVGTIIDVDTDDPESEKVFNKVNTITVSRSSETQPVVLEASVKDPEKPSEVTLEAKTDPASMLKLLGAIKWVQITSEEFDALEVKDPNTLYLVKRDKTPNGEPWFWPSDGGGYEYLDGDLSGLVNPYSRAANKGIFANKNFHHWNIPLDNLETAPYLFFYSLLYEWDTPTPKLKSARNTWQYSREMVTFGGYFPVLEDATNICYSNSKLTTVTADLSSVVTGVNAFYATPLLTIFTSDLTNLSDGRNMFWGSGLDAETINRLLSTLPVVTGSHIITFTGCPGAATCDPTIGTAKGWTVQR